MMITFDVVVRRVEIRELEAVEEAQPGPSDGQEPADGKHALYS